MGMDVGMNKAQLLVSLIEEFVNNTRRTQVSTTGGTYEKTGAFLKDKLQPNSKILSVGAGLDHTRVALSKGLGEHTHTIHDMEPNPEGRKTKPEYTKAEDIPKNSYHAVVSHNVINVVEPHVREHVMHSIFNSVKEGGHAVIGTRKWNGDIALNKNSDPGSEPKSMWVKKKGAVSYQKGYDGNELKDYVEDYAKRNGHTVTVKKLPNIAATSVHIQIHKKGK
jgi:SAM-dependent methyltransferase